MSRSILPAALFVMVLSLTCSDPVSSPPSEVGRYRTKWYHKRESLCTSAADLEVAATYTMEGTGEFIVRRRAGDSRESAQIEHVAMTVKRLDFAVGYNCERSGHSQPVIVSQPEVLGELRTGGRLVNIAGKQFLEIQYSAQIKPGVVRYTLDDGTVVERGVGSSLAQWVMQIPCAVRIERHEYAYRGKASGADPDWAYWGSSDLLMVEEPQ